MRFRVGIIGTGDQEALVALRRVAYASSSELELHDLERLEWSSHDEHAAVLGAWRVAEDRTPDELVASFRLIRFDRRSAAEAFLEYSLEGVPEHYPALAAGRSVTLPAYQRHGLHAWMRLAYLRALPSTQVRSVLSVVYESAPRVASLLAIGFEAYRCRSHWDSEARLLAEPLIAMLAHQRFAAALEACTQQLGGAEHPVDIDDDAVVAAIRRLAARP